MSSYCELVSDTYKLILSIVPKSGCTFVSEWYVRDILNYKNHDIDAVKYIINNTLYKNIYNYENYTGYTYYLFIRCPIERCISCFINKFVKRYDININYYNLEPAFKSLLDKYNYTSITFNIFLDIIEDELKNKNDKDIHINYQIDKLKIINLKKYCNIEVVKINDLSKKITELSKQLNIIPSFNYCDKMNMSIYNDQSGTDITDTISYDIVSPNILDFKLAFPRILKIYCIDKEFFDTNG